MSKNLVASEKFLCITCHFPLKKYCKGVLIFENRFNSSLSIGQREKFIADAIFIAKPFKRFVDSVIINFAGARLVASGTIRNVNMSDLIEVFFNVVAECALVVLHVVSVEQNHQVRRIDKARNFCRHLRCLQKILATCAASRTLSKSRGGYGRNGAQIRFAT